MREKKITKSQCLDEIMRLLFNYYNLKMETDEKSQLINIYLRTPFEKYNQIIAEQERLKEIRRIEREKEKTERIYKGKR